MDTVTSHIKPNYIRCKSTTKDKSWVDKEVTMVGVAIGIAITCVAFLYSIGIYFYWAGEQGGVCFAPKHKQCYTIDK